MDEREYMKHADAAFKRIENAFAEVDPDLADCERTQGDVLTITFGDGKRCIINTQRPTRQIWVAANARAWHFSFDEAGQVWRDDKDASLELYPALEGIV